MCLCHVSCIFTIRNYVHGLGSLVYDFVGRYISNSFISICIKMHVCCVFFIVSLVALRARLTLHIRELLNFPTDPTDFPMFMFVSSFAATKWHFRWCARALPIRWHGRCTHTPTRARHFYYEKLFAPVVKIRVLYQHNTKEHNIQVG